MDISQTRREFLQLGTALIVRPGRSRQGSLGRVVTVVGTGIRGSAAEGDLTDSAQINSPFFALIGPDGLLYWSDIGTQRILRADLRTKRISVVAGNGTRGYSGDGGPAKSAQLNGPHEVRFDSKGDLYFVERDSAVVRRVDMRSGTISTVAGTGKTGYSGDVGPATKAEFNQPHGINFDRDDNLYICDPLNNRLRRVDAKTGTVTTFAGNGQTGRAPDEGSLTGTALAGPRSVEFPKDGKIYLALREGNSIFTLDPVQGRVKRIAGSGENGYSGDGGPAILARFGSAGPGGLTGPKGLTISDDGILYVADCENHVIRRIDLRTGIISTAVGNGQRGHGADGEPRQCMLARPHSVFAYGRTVYITDSDNHRIRALEFEA
jgi:sugar lactone lactonase YvrE